MRNQTKQDRRGGWRHWSENEAREELDAFARSGMSAAAFARDRGISASRMDYWKKRLRPGSAVEFVPVALPPARPQSIEIVVGDVLVRVPEGLDIELVAQLVAALAGQRAC